MINPISSVVSSAASGSAGVSTAPAAGGANVAAPGQTDFANVLADVSSGAIGSIKNAETVAISGIEGKQSVQRVVEAIMSAEQTLQTAIAVRDKVVSAYQEISRMAI